jgi:hypothetical protein
MFDPCMDGVCTAEIKFRLLELPAGRLLDKPSPARGSADDAAVGLAPKYEVERSLARWYTSTSSQGGILAGSKYLLGGILACKLA